MKGVFLDIETDGIDPDLNQVLQIGLVIYDLQNMMCIEEYESFVRCSHRHWVMNSDPVALLINGIKFKDVEHAKQASEISDDLTELFLTHEIDKTNSVFICHNSSFDKGFFPQIMPIETQQELELPYHWLDLASMYWMKMLVPQHVNGRTVRYHASITKSALSKYSIAHGLGVPIEEKPHRALNGAKHLISCYCQLFSV